MTMLAIVNGASAGGKTAARWAAIEAALANASIAVEAVFTEGPGHATELACEAVSAGRDKLACCGGDGTLSEVVNGLIDRDGKARVSDVKLAILPSGTGGDFRKTLGIDADPAAAAALIARGQTRTIDAGLIEYSDGSEPRRFVNIASCGVGYEVDRRVNGLRFKPGKLAYAAVSAYSTLTYKQPKLSVIVDGQKTTGTFISVAFANGKCFGGGMKVAPLADPSDGQLDVIMLATTRIKSLTGSRHLYAGTHLERDGATMLRGSVIEVSPLDDSAVGFDVDGEAIGFCPARIRALPGVLDVYC